MSVCKTEREREKARKRKRERENEIEKETEKKKREREREREKLFSRAMDTTDHVFWMTGLPSLYMDFDQQNC